MLASRPSIFKSAVSMLLSLTQSPGKLTGDFFWTRSRKAEWSCVISTALWFFLRTHQFVKVDGNLGTFPMQAFDSLLPFGTQYILHFLKEQKNQGLLAGFFLQPSPSARHRLRVLLSLGLWQEGGLHLKSGQYSDSADLLGYRDLNILVTPLPTVLQWFP